MSLVAGVRVIGFLSIILAAAVVGVSGWLLKDSYEHRKSGYGDVNQGISSGTRYITDTFGGTLHKIDPDKADRMKIGVAAASLAAGALQLITSIFLLFCSSSKGGRVSARLWIFVNLFVILACAGSFICLLSQQQFQDEVKKRDENHQLKAFLGATGVDAVFLFIFSFVTGAFGCRSG